MKFNKTNTFQSGREYTLSHLFSGNNKIIIPDLQRDYCWGDRAWNKDAKQYTELVSGFLKSLIESYKEEGPNKKLTLGLIYGYENPKYHIQLCDGQQRITTLFLILGIVNRKTNNKFRQYLISDFELKEFSKEPYLQYAIRDSTLYFLSDLVCKYFIKSEKEILFNQIERSSWYFSEYNLDASIRSMLSAIKTIEVIFNELSNFNFDEYGYFITQNLQMLYYDMGNRTRGEETFVIINTTGEPLSATENLKPIIIGNITDEALRKRASDEWEEREEWFWQNKNDELTSDSGLNQFFIWYWQIRLLQESTWKSNMRYTLNPQEIFSKKPKPDENEEKYKVGNWDESIKTETIHRYFEAFYRLVEICKEVKVDKVLKTINNGKVSAIWFRNADLNVVLPLIGYLEKFNQAKLFYEFVRRIRKNYFDKERKRGNFVDWRYIVQIIEFSDSEENILYFETKRNESKFKFFSNVVLNEWYNDDEQQKDLLKEEHKEEIENWEDHIDLMGNLTPFWKANAGHENSYENLKSIYDNFELFYSCYDNTKSDSYPILSNYVRLYRMLSESNRLAKPYNTSGMKGAWFSWKNQNNISYFEYLKNDFFLSLFKINESVQLLESLKSRLKEILPKENIKITDENFDAINYLKIWTLIKVLKAEENGTLLAFWDGRGTERNDGSGLASYIDCSRNKINRDLPFSIGNSICGYAVKKVSRIEYATNDKYWGEQHCFDTIIGNSITLTEFQNRKEIPISLEKIQKIDEEVQVLLNAFYQEQLPNKCSET